MKRSFLLAMFFFSAYVTASNDLALYDKRGNAVVYISVDDELTLYSWDVVASAYLKRSQSNEFDVYGFNGNHLGWFTKGILIDHDGYVACAVKDRVTTPNLPSFKSLKSLKPLKSLPQLPPLFPLLKNAFGQTNCSLLVASGVT